MKPKNIFLAGVLLLSFCLSALNLAAANRHHGLFDPLVDIAQLVRQNYVTETNDEQLAVGAINGLLHQLDPYSEYIPADQVEEFQKLTAGSYEGIGIGIDIEDGFLTVISPFEDTPAWDAGILPGDRIIEVDGESTKGWSATKAVQQLTGPAGSAVRITILRPDSQHLELTLTRRQIHVPTVRGWRRSADDNTWDYLLDPDNGVGYIRVTQFTEDTADELDRAVHSLQRSSLKALILDLRANPGGILSAAVAVADRFINDGVIVSTKGAHTQPSVERATTEQTYPHFPLIVLVDAGSASASEIVAGALQDHHRAVVVGQRSWGKGSVQRVFRLPSDGAVCKLTTDYYYLPSGRCVHKLPDAELWGVDPDVEQALDPDKLLALRDHMAMLTRVSRNGAQLEAPTGAEIAPAADDQAIPGDSEDVSETDPAYELLRLDDQLDQAAKQARGLLRAQPTLPTLSASLAATTNTADPAPTEDADLLEIAP